jgi:ABC-2 type transport system permease protein
MRILDLILKDLSQLLREKRALLFLVLMPIAFTVFMGIAYRGGSSNGDARLALGWVNPNPGGFAGKTLHDLLSQSDVVRLEELDPASDSAALSEQVRSGKLAGALVVPPNFNLQVLKGHNIPLLLITNELSTQGQSVVQTVRGALTRLMSSVEVASLVVDNLGIKSESQHSAILQDASAAWKKLGHSGPGYSLEKAQGAPTVSSILAENPFKQSSPGTLVQFAIFGLVTSAGVLVDERKNGTLQRLMTTSMPRAGIIAGHLLAMFTVVMMQALLLVLFGQFFLNIDYFRQPAAVLLMLVALGLCVASLGLLIGVSARDESQVVLFSLIAMFLFSALGGAWFPMESVGEGFATVGHLTPAFYAMQGLQNILIRGQDISSVFFPAAMLAGFALLFFGAALWRFEAGQAR